MSDFVQARAEGRRLRILMAISEENDKRLSDGIIKRKLDLWGWRYPIEVVKQDLRYLATVGAISIAEANDELAAELHELGRQHLVREMTIEGVEVPRLGRG